jgi:hypothetical protein
VRLVTLGSRTKDPADARTYSIDWSPWLAGLPTADTIASSVWSLPAGVTLVAQANTTTKTSVRVSGGTTGTNYSISNTVTTTNGEIKKVLFQLVVR